MGTLIDRFEEHDGPVRGICFHLSQPIFVSGGDDYKIKVWNYKTRRCLYTLNGHLDYVRTVFFHHEYPWILSASDDQTVRIWNWQSRQCIAILTGHNHYVMCAQFHPKDDLVVSGSLDQTVRIWDISGLRKKNAAPTSAQSFEEQIIARSMGAQQQNDIFGNIDIVVKYVLEGHDRGVNWVAFHPTLPLIASAGDDRLVKLWRMSETKAWEVDTCRGHFNNVSAVLFHPSQDLILSCGEDKTIRLWDANKRTSVQSFRRENDRFWVVTAHPHINLFAAGHDSGVMVFKLDRERPAGAIFQSTLFYINKERLIKSYDFTTQTESPALVSLRKLGPAWLQPRSLSYNPAERSVLVTSSFENGTYELLPLPKDNSGTVTDQNDAKRGKGDSAVFVARNRFAVLEKAKQTLHIKDLSNAVTKSISLPVPGVNEIFFGGAGNILLATSTAVLLFDIQQKIVIKELAAPNVKYAVWNNEGTQVALLGKHTITIASKTLEQLYSLHETIRIKSAAWDDLGVLLYSTLNHIKYFLSSGDKGIIKTLDQTIYLLKVKGNSVYCLNREAQPTTLTIDTTEYRFKLALLKRNYEEMLQIIKTSTLVGQSIISYLQKRGYPEIALQFVQDPSTRFDLALECGDIDIALENAKEIDKPEIWERLAQNALKQGNHQIVEYAYQKLHNFDKLSLLYLSIGDTEKLQKMATIASQRVDFSAAFQNSIFLGDVDARIQIFRESGLYPLAYLAAKSSGKQEVCEEILAECGLSESQIKLPQYSKAVDCVGPLPVLRDTFREVQTPTVTKTAHSLFEKAVLEEMEHLAIKEPDDTFNNFAEVDGLDGDMVNINETGEEVLEGEEGAWDMGQEEIEVEGELQETVEDLDQRTSLDVATKETDLWVRNSPVAAHHIAAGSFETAMQLLHRQVGLVNFDPLKPYFMKIMECSTVYMPAYPSLSPLPVHIRKDVHETDTRRILPYTPFKVSEIVEKILPETYKLVKSNKLEDAIVEFRNALKIAILTAVASQEEVDELSSAINLCREYIVGLSAELERRRVETEFPEDSKRQLELACYFAHAKLQPAHQQFAFASAMRIAYKFKNFVTAGHFASKLLEIVQSGNIADQVSFYIYIYIYI